MPPILKTLIEQRRRFASFTGGRYRIKKPAALGYPIALEIGYRKQVRETATFLTSLVEKHLFPRLPAIIAEAKSERFDAYTDTLDEIVNTVQQEYGDRYSEETIRSMASNQANQVSNYHRRRLTKILSNSIGIDVFMTEPYLQTELRAFVQQNVDLIQSIPQEHFNDLRLTVKRAIRSGKTTKDVEKEIKQRWGDVLKDKPKNRAELIARDQNGKLFGQINQLRQTELGIQKYIWRTVKDGRVRPSHADKEGKEFSWDKPPFDTGHPGQDFQCRCWAEPVVLSVFNEEEAAGIPDPQPIKKAARKTANIFASWQIDKGIAKGIDGSLKAINKVYKPKKVKLEPIPINQSYGKRTAGALHLEYVREVSKTGLSSWTIKPTNIKVSKKAGAQEMTFSHEFGHYLDYSLGKNLTGRYAAVISRSDARFAPFWEAIDNSKSIKTLKAYSAPRQFKNLDEYLAWKKTLPPPPLSDKYQRYLLSEKEVWARSFAQYVATESKDPKLIAQIADERKFMHAFAQWDEEDFEPIRKAIKQILDELG